MDHRTTDPGETSDAVRAPASLDDAAWLTSASVVEVLASLAVDRTIGLSEAEVASRRATRGWNEVAEAKGHPAIAFLSKFWGISSWMLELIILLSAVLGKYADVVVVSALLFINAVIGFVQERRAAGVVEALRRRLRVDARVLREARWRIVPGRELVPGDILRLRSGDIVPADVKVIEGTTRIDQSSLTGESADVDKSAGEVVPSGALVRRGETMVVVVLTGAHTYFGRTTELVQQSRPTLHIERVVSSVVRWLFVIVASVLALVMLASLLRGESLVEIAPLMLVLLMSAVPVALPVMFTVSMAVAARELAKRGVLVTRLSATEDAATMDVLCVDKTGTITMNQLTLTDVLTVGDATESDVLVAGALASEEANQDPIDLAILTAASERHAFAASSHGTVVSFVPFDASTRRTEAVVESNGRRIVVMKGAVRSLAQVCGLGASELEALDARIAESTKSGHRVIAVARGPEAGPPKLVGLLVLFDPLRPDAAELVGELHALGVRVMVLTGDSLSVARETGRSVGLPKIERKADLDREATALPGVRNPYDAVDGLAEVYPEDKHEVVRRLQAAGHVAGMTGDGVNDAPALRQAEVGIAVSSATDVAKGAASVVLTQPGLTNIVTLIRQGRMIYQRVLTWIVNKISRTILKAGFVCVAYLFTGRFVISAFAMLLLVFMTDFAKIAISTDRVEPSRQPETWKIRGLVSMATVLGLAMLAETLGFLYVGWKHFGLAANAERLSTFSFVMLVYFAAFSLLSVRERRRFWRTAPSAILAAGLGLELTVATLVAIVGAPGLQPLPWSQTASLFVYAAVSCLVVNDSLKVASMGSREQTRAA